MALDSLVSCFVPNETSAKEVGKSVFIERKEGELILKFKTESNDFKKHLSISSVSDSLFVYYKINTNNIIEFIFVELKGKHVHEGIGQLSVTIMALKDKLKSLIPKDKKFIIKALLVCSGASPKNNQQEIDKFINSTGIPLKVNSGDKYDLRNIIEKHNTK